MEEVIEVEEHTLSDYVKNTEKGYNRLLTCFTREMSKIECKQKNTENRIKSWKDKPLHGQYPRLVADTDEKKTFMWVKAGFMKKRDRRDAGSGSGPSSTNKMEESKHRGYSWNNFM